MRLKAIAEIYTMHSFAQLCNLNFFEKKLSKFARNSAKILQNSAELAKLLKFFEKNYKILAVCFFLCAFLAVQRNALCRSRRELSNAYLLAKFGFDTAENEPSKVGRLGRGHDDGVRHVAHHRGRGPGRRARQVATVF